MGNTWDHKNSFSPTFANTCKRPKKVTYLVIFFPRSRQGRERKGEKENDQTMLSSILRGGHKSLLLRFPAQRGRKKERQVLLFRIKICEIVISPEGT